MRPWQIRLSTDGRHPMFPREPERRQAVRVLVHTAGRETALFGIVDDHVHVVLYCDRPTVTWRARSLCRVLRGRSAVEIAPSHISAVNSRGHMATLVGYILNQTGHHGLPVHPALWTGSCFPDIIGARALPGLDLQLFRALPRLQPWEICQEVGLDLRDLQPMGLDEIRSLGAARILAASSAVLAVGPGLEHQDRSCHLVRALVAQTGLAANLSVSEMGWVLGCTIRHVSRLDLAPISEPQLRCVRVRLALEEAVARQQARQGLLKAG